MQNQMQTKNRKLVNKLLSGTAGEKYRGKQVVVIGGKAFILPDNDQESAKLVERLEEKYPSQIPHLVFVPQPETYVL